MNNITTFIDEAIHDICTDNTDHGMRRVKTRKVHDCSFCGRQIPVGEDARFWEGRVPRYDDNDRQIGIEYIRDWLCSDYDACFGRGNA